MDFLSNDKIIYEKEQLCHETLTLRRHAGTLLFIRELFVSATSLDTIDDRKIDSITITMLKQ